ANGTEFGRGTLPDARETNAAETPIAINGAYQGTAIAASCENHQVNEQAGERRGIFHRLTFADINCQVNYGGRPAGTLTMAHSPHGSIVAAAPAPVAVVAAVR
ncbi:MAG: hypothetical protein JWO26_3941, partial [Rhodospirillales bacterium]|nr:hypothetical protein [Rhodospirillales bacterium]